MHAFMKACRQSCPPASGQRAWSSCLRCVGVDRRRCPLPMWCQCGVMGFIAACIQGSSMRCMVWGSTRPKRMSNRDVESHCVVHFIGQRKSTILPSFSMSLGLALTSLRSKSRSADSQASVTLERPEGLDSVRHGWVRPGGNSAVLTVTVACESLVTLVAARARRHRPTLARCEPDLATNSG